MTTTPQARTARDVPTQPADVVARALRIGRLGAVRSAPDAGRLVMVSDHIVDGEDTQCQPLSATARSVLRLHGGLWFGWSGRIADAPDVTTGHDVQGGYDVAATYLSAADHKALYNGFPMHVLQPLLRRRVHEMRFDRTEMSAWLRANAHLAATLQAQLKADDRIWINGLHLLPMVHELRALGVTNRIGLLVHDVLPPRDLLVCLPHHEHVFSALADCDLIGVQTAGDVHVLRKYLMGVHRDASVRGDVLSLGSRSVRMGVFPVGIDVERTARLAQQAAAEVPLRRDGANSSVHKLLVSVDQPGNTSGLCKRLCAIGHLLEESPELAGTFSLLQVSPPAGSDASRSPELEYDLARCLREVNGLHATPDWLPVRCVERDFPMRTLLGYLRAADIGLMTPLHDGMTLAAKEYVACQDPEDPGVLLLSCFAGAARELRGAVWVNPLDATGVAAAIRAAMYMPLDERRARWETMMEALRRRDLRHWSGDFLDAMAATRATRSVRAGATDGVA